MTTGQAWTIITGLDYGSVNGALWGGGLGLSTKGVVGLSLATSVAATSVAIFVASTQSPKAGDIELVRSSLLWGTTAGLLAAAAFSSSNTSSESAWRAGAIAMDVGLGAGIGLANSFDLSRNRVLIIDAGALGGGLVGLGIALLADGNNVSGQTVAGGALGGLVAGIVIAALATQQPRHRRDPSPRTRLPRPLRPRRRRPLDGQHARPHPGLRHHRQARRGRVIVRARRTLLIARRPRAIMRARERQSGRARRNHRLRPRIRGPLPRRARPPPPRPRHRALKFEHIGSTAVPGLAGKPIVDLMLGAPPAAWAGLEELRARIVALGYEDLGEAGVPGRV